MLCMITQAHAPESCPIEAGGSSDLYNPKAKGAKLQAMYGAYAQHTIWYVVEADSVEAIQEFLTPGFLRCTSTVTPISSVPMVKK
ncbi:MAG: hypothetical protein HYU85_08865 [Chloroflexi bacterium]|nr:hypothetical protein [Chloroflexota bacterium]